MPAAGTFDSSESFPVLAGAVCTGDNRRATIKDFARRSNESRHAALRPHDAIRGAATGGVNRTGTWGHPAHGQPGRPMRPATTRTCRGAASQIAPADTKLTATPMTNASR